MIVVLGGLTNADALAPLSTGIASSAALSFKKSLLNISASRFDILVLLYEFSPGFDSADNGRLHSFILTTRFPFTADAICRTPFSLSKTPKKCNRLRQNTVEKASEKKPWAL